MRFTSAVLAGCLLLCGPAAGADPVPVTSSPALEPWAVRVDVSLEASLTHRQIWEPVSIAPDFYLGLPHRLTVGLFHSTRAAGLLDSGGGLCLRSEDHGCVEDYAGVGGDAILGLWSGHGASISARTRLYVDRFTEPSKPRLAPGFAIDYQWRRFSVLADPHLIIGLVNRDRGNENTLNIPIWMGLRVAGPVDVYFRSGLYSGLSNFADKFQIPFGLGVGVVPEDRFRLELQLVLPELIGPLNTPRPRDLLLRVSYVP